MFEIYRLRLQQLRLTFLSSQICSAQPGSPSAAAAPFAEPAEERTHDAAGASPPDLATRPADETWHYRTVKGVFGPHSLAQLRAWRPEFEAKGVFASLRVWRALLDDEARDSMLLSDALDAQQEPEAAPEPAPAPAPAEQEAFPPEFHFVGVREAKAGGGGTGWQARLRFGGKQLNLGNFNTQHEAAKQIDRCADELFPSSYLALSRHTDI